MRFLHTSDWHIGKNFTFADNDTLRVLQDERLEAIKRLGQAARTHDASAVLVAGDIYDVEIPSDRTLRQPIERMRQFPGIQWHLIPGNHDAHTQEGPWQRLLRIGLPENVTLHLTPEPKPLSAREPTGWVVPAVLTRRHTLVDPTLGMGAQQTPVGGTRIGLAHGSILDGGLGDAAHNRIAPDRATQAQLAYLALGDWHGFQRINTRTAYSGTPEPDGFDRGGDGGGNALLVTLDGPQALPIVTPVPIGRFLWRRETANLLSEDDIHALDRRLRAFDHDDPARVLVWLAVDGSLDVDALRCWTEIIREGASSALRLLRIAGEPALRTSPADIGRLSGALRHAAETLQDLSARDDHAAAAFARLFLMAGREDEA